MQERNVIVTWEAIYDLTDIADYIERDFGKDRADRFEREIKQQIADIGHMGGSYGNTHIYYRSYAVYKKTLLAFYYILYN